MTAPGVIRIEGMKTLRASWLSVLALSVGLAACGDSDTDSPPDGPTPFDPATAPRVEVDRFSEAAGTLLVRTADNGLPGANQPIDMDQAPFITQGHGPNREIVRYYNFDVMPTTPAPIFVLFRAGDDAPVANQLNIIDVIPGDPGYNDFWHVHKVTVPADYVANTVASFDGITEAGFTVEPTDILVNCPVVPDGSTASLGGGGNGLIEGWYREQVVSYFSFEEKALTTAPDSPAVPLSPIFVTFNVNPDQTGGGPASGFVVEPDSTHTHNVVATLPDDDDYSPLWSVNAYDNADFDAVSDLASASAANILGEGVATVNCPIVDIQDPAALPAEATRVSVDRFSADAGTLFVRDGDNLPAADAPIDFDQGPFITRGLSPSGGAVEYYNFDVMPTTAAPIFVLFREGADMPVPGQLNIIDAIPGDAGYSDFWHVQKVTVPASYVPNQVTSLAEIGEAGFTVESTDILVNCPVVPAGSTATKRVGGGHAGLFDGWYQGNLVSYFSFEEAPLSTNPDTSDVPLSPIHVTFNINPDETGGGPPSGFKTEPGTMQTHNVVATIPGDEGYSPLWTVNVYDNADFDSVSDLTSAVAATTLAEGVATVNCPIVTVP